VAHVCHFGYNEMHDMDVAEFSGFLEASEKIIKAENGK
jgi:hypothetical protein